MSRTIGNALRLVAFGVWGFSAFAGDTITVEPMVAKTAYCSTSNGQLTMWVSLAVKYKNDLQAPIILSTVSRVAGYALFGDEEQLKRNRPLRNVVPKFAAMFDPSKVDQSQPNPTMFQVIQPGRVAERLYNISFIVRRPGLRPLSSGDYYLRVAVDPWPADRRSAKNLAQLWHMYGRLWMDFMVLPPTPLHIDEPSVRTEPCRLRVD
jgi:hypothetical protein